MDRNYSNRLPLTHWKMRILYLIIVFVIFLIFQNVYSYFLFVFFTVYILRCYYSENCNLFYIKSQNDLIISPLGMRNLVKEITFIIWVSLAWILTIALIKITISEFNLYSSILTSEYFYGMCLILGAICVVVVLKLFHRIIFNELEKETKKDGRA